jgi:hypothetical protein
MVPQAQLRDPGRYLQEAASTLTSTGRLQGTLRVPAAIAPIKVTADLRAGLIHCAVTVPAPREGRSALLPDTPIPGDVPAALQDDRAGELSQIAGNVLPVGGFAPGPYGRTPFTGGQTSR